MQLQCTVYSVDDQSLNWQTYNEPVTINSDCRLLVRAIAKDGLKTPIAQRYEFTMPPKQAQIADETALKSKPVHYSRYYKNEGTNIMSPIVHMPYNLTNVHNGHHQTSVGLLKIKEAGKYSFFFHAKQAGKLTLGDTVLFDGDEPSGEMASVYLTPGYYNFQFISKGSALFDFEWKTPGKDWQQIAPKYLFHRQKTFDKYMHEFKTQKKLR